jgi:hypothetical protein
VLIRRHKQLITLFAALVILLVQFAALVHATEHPFHQEDALCISLQSAEQNKHFFHAVSYSLYRDVFISDSVTLLTESVFTSLSSYYSSRAPPVNAIRHLFMPWK